MENINAQRNKILRELYEQLPEEGREFLLRGAIFYPLSASVSSLIANSAFRKVLNVSKARIVSVLPTVCIPLVSTCIMYDGLIIKPLLTGDLSSLSLAVARGGLFGSTVGALYPMAMALLLNGGLAARYSTAALPRMGNIFNFWIITSRPIFKKMGLVLALQTMAGAYLGFRIHEIYINLLQTLQTEKQPRD